MKVKGWVVVDLKIKHVYCFKNFKVSAEMYKREYEKYDKVKLHVKPCTITIHDKAVGK